MSVALLALLLFVGLVFAVRRSRWRWLWLAVPAVIGVGILVPILQNPANAWIMPKVSAILNGAPFEWTPDANWNGQFDWTEEQPTLIADTSRLVIPSAPIGAQRVYLGIPFFSIGLGVLLIVVGGFLLGSERARRAMIRTASIAGFLALALFFWYFARGRSGQPIVTHSSAVSRGEQPAPQVFREPVYTPGPYHAGRPTGHSTPAPPAIDQSMKQVSEQAQSPPAAEAPPANSAAPPTPATPLSAPIPVEPTPTSPPATETQPPDSTAPPVNAAPGEAPAAANSPASTAASEPMATSGDSPMNDPATSNTAAADPQVATGEPTPATRSTPVDPPNPAAEPVAPAAATSPPNSPVASAAESTNGSTTESASASKQAQPSRALPPRPAWVESSLPYSGQGNVYVRVESELYSTLEECRSSLLDAARRAVNDYLVSSGATYRPQEKLLDWISPAVLRKTIETEYLEEVPLKSLDGAKVMRLWALLKFTPKLQHEVEAAWRASVIEGRLIYSALAGGSLLTLIGIVFAYLRLDLWTAGIYRLRLRLAAMAAIVLACGGAYAVASVLRLPQ